MPELPEVEVMTERMSDVMGGCTIRDVEVLRGDNYLPDDSRMLVGRLVAGVWRRGKFMLVYLDDGFVLVCHNAMSGFWDTLDEPWTFDYVEGKRQVKDDDVRVKLLITDRNGIPRIVRFHDARLFGRIDRMSRADAERKMNNLGPDLLSTTRLLPGTRVASADDFVEEVARRCRKQEIKHALMRQDVLAGGGNIYVAESLWWAGIDPWKPAGEISELLGVSALHSLISTIDLSIVKKIDYDNVLHVYRKDTCSACNSRIEKAKLRGRTTYFCRKCQNVR